MEIHTLLQMVSLPVLGIIYTFYFGFGTTYNNTQELILTLHSGITLGGLTGPYKCHVSNPV